MRSRDYLRPWNVDPVARAISKVNVYFQRADAELAYQLQVAKEQQKIRQEEMQIQVRFGLGGYCKRWTIMICGILGHRKSEANQSRRKGNPKKRERTVRYGSSACRG